MSEHLRDQIAQALTDHAATTQDGIHSWRCAHPDIYGHCDCADELLEDLLAVTRQAQAEAYQRGADDWADEQGRTVPNPYRQATP